MAVRSSAVGSMVYGAATTLAFVLSATPAGAATLSTTAAADLEIVPYVEDVTGPTDVAVLPDGRVVVIERTGNVYTKPVGDGELTQARVNVNSSHGEQGLLGVVADPDFETNQYLYFYASIGNDSANRHQVLRYKLGADGSLSDMKVVVAMGLRGPANHNGGALDIYQGNLYIGVGDTGANATPPTNKFGSCLNIPNGKVLRVSLAEATLGQPPSDNPLVNEAMVTSCKSATDTMERFGMQAPEKRIFAWGFRNPFRIWVDRRTGLVWVGDVGETTREEISVVSKGNHAGYPFFEGTKEWSQDFKPANACMGLTPGVACVPPVVDWARGSGGSSTGGRILDGCGWPAAWKSRYVFGDHEQGKMWSIDVNAARNGMVPGSQKEFATTNQIRSIRMGTDNALYLVESNRVSRVTAKNTTSTPGSCKAVDGEETPGGGEGGASSGGGAGEGTAGSPSPGGGQSSSGGNATGGTSSNAGGPSPSGGSATAGTSASGAGSPSSGGGGGAGSDSGGCGCRAAGSTSGSLLGLGAVAAGLAAALRRRRREP